MKLHNLIFLFLCLILFSCNHKSEILYLTLPIEKEYDTMMHIYNRSEISDDELKDMPNLKLVINSDDEFPVENLLGLDELKESDIDFQKYTLLLVYYKMPGEVDVCTYGVAKDFENDKIIFSVNYHMIPDLKEIPERDDIFTYCRSAILVTKIPEDTEVKFRLSY